jgi:hypothetical protein
MKHNFINKIEPVLSGMQTLILPWTSQGVFHTSGFVSNKAEWYVITPL